MGPGEVPGGPEARVRAATPGGLPAATWTGVAVIGALLFGVGVWIPAWKGIPYGEGVSYLFAIGGAVLFMLGATFAYRAYVAGRRTLIEEIPGVSVFRPGAASTAPGDMPPLDPPPTGGIEP